MLFSLSPLLSSPLLSLSLSLSCCVFCFQAVCCSDGQHCCPDQHRCDPNTQACIPEHVTSHMITCPDRNTTCPFNFTCCLMSAQGKYGCCPLPQVSDECEHGLTDLEPTYTHPKYSEARSMVTPNYQ